MTDEVSMAVAEAEELAMTACRAAGASEATARSLVDATMSAVFFGPATLGFPHMVDYLNSFREGRINCNPAPILERPYPAFFVSDADLGMAWGLISPSRTSMKCYRAFGFQALERFTDRNLGYTEHPGNVILTDRRCRLLCCS